MIIKKRPRQLSSLPFLQRGRFSCFCFRLLGGRPPPRVGMEVEVALLLPDATAGLRGRLGLVTDRDRAPRSEHRHLLRKIAAYQQNLPCLVPDDQLPPLRLYHSFPFSFRAAFYRLPPLEDEPKQKQQPIFILS